MTVNKDAAPVLVAKDGNILVITINRPEVRNAIDAATHSAIGRALVQAENDDTVWAVIITGSGTTSFCAGADLKARARGEPILPDDPVERAWGFAGVVAHPIGKPLIAAVNGPAVGGGMEILLACDLAVAAEHAVFGVPEVKRGLYAGAGGAFRLPAVLPRKIALELLLTGDSINASRALELGLINRIVPQDQALDGALVLARRITANAPIAVQATKRIALGIRNGHIVEEANKWSLTALEGERVKQSEDVVEGVNAFLQKRPPVWKAR